MAEERGGKREIKSPQGKIEEILSALMVRKHPMGLSDPDIRAVLEEIPGFLETSACPQNINSLHKKCIFHSY